ncbi:hypothetical protein E0W68_11755 [Flavobacterium salilacus subsp. salilacus]|uniref:hypothetical protein n=1 Tax=Flavobacterium TaxID=237 RepID=UPI001075393E|nr:MULTISPECIES: hypothetical protein [Flavobacterium]KAF2516883.1 hypothetical protein E0W68_11755 [Flavobacterium salilacus subsp. salilacus]MBE1615757.1 hypothetical protein [Flavobacterium sp. SaA2.13]
MRLYILLLMFTCLGVSAQNEYMSWEDLSINKKIPLTISKKDFDKKYEGKYEVIPTEPQETCSADKSNVVIIDYKGVHFEVVGDTLQFRSIDFSQRRNMYIQFRDDDWFDHTTTLKYFKKAYPIIGDMSEEYIDENGEVAEILTFFPEDKNAPYEWRLYFTNGKLEFMECFLYCP